jgi:1-acyl-sn-glycerol-3-phosphate acyltransferase
MAGKSSKGSPSAPAPDILREIREMARSFRWGRRPLVPSSAEPHAPAPEKKEFPTDWARTPLGNAAREFVQQGLMKPIYWNETAPKVEGLDNLEDIEAPVIFISNHSSHLDAGLILSALPHVWRRKTATGAAADYFFDTWWKSIGTAITYNAFPIDRGSRGRQIPTARRLLNDGWNLLVFPEGTRSPDGWVQRFRHGTSRLCIEMQVPAVPIGIRGAHAAMPKGRTWPRSGRLPVSVRFGTPIYPEPDEDHREFSRRLTQGVSQLLDEDRTSWFESVKRASEGKTPSASGPDGPNWLRVWEGARPLARSGKRRAWPR